MVCQSFVDAGLADIRDQLAELLNCNALIFLHCFFHFHNGFVLKRWSSRTLFVKDVCIPIFEFSAPFAHVLYAHTLFSVDFTQLGMNVHVFAHKNRITERNWHLVKQVGAPSLMADTPRLGAAASLQGQEMGKEQGPM